MNGNIKYLAMAIVNMTNDINSVDTRLRQNNNDECFDFAINKIKEFLEDNSTNIYIKADNKEVTKSIKDCTKKYSEAMHNLANSKKDIKLTKEEIIEFKKDIFYDDEDYINEFFEDKKINNTYKGGK